MLETGYKKKVKNLKKMLAARLELATLRLWDLRANQLRHASNVIKHGYKIHIWIVQLFKK